MGTHLARRFAPLVAVGATSAVAALIGADVATAVLLLLVCVTGSALLGRSEGLLASIVSAAALSYVFIPPRWRFSLGKREDVLALVTYVFVAITVATLLERLRTVQRAEAEAIRMAAEARTAAEIERHRAAFFAAAGHNLRTPLTSLRTAAATLACHRRSLSEAEFDRLAKAVVDETTRLEHLVNRVLQVARIQATAVVPAPEIVDLVGVAQTTIGRVDERGVIVELDVDEPSPPLVLDSLLVEQALLNLVENAVEFAPEDSTVRVEGRHVGRDGYELRVIDHGPGVPSEQRELIFREFHSGRRPDGSTSTGLGLSIATSLVAAQGGAIRLDDTIGGGATFTIVLRPPTGSP